MKLTITTTPEQDAGLQFATSAFNASAQKSHDAEQARLPEKDRIAYELITEEDYAMMRLNDVLNSYAKQASEVELNSLFSAVEKLPKSDRDAAVAELKSRVG